MSRTAEVKVRLDAAEEKVLAAIAAAEGINRSEVLRRGLQAYDQRRREETALEKLMGWAGPDEARLGGKKPRKTRYRMA